MERIKKWLKKESVLVLSFCCALVSVLFVPPSAAYLKYIDFRVLALLFCLMAVIAGFERCGLFYALAQKLLQGKKSLRFLQLALVLLPFFSSMLITNDVALLTFVPFAILVLELTGQLRALPFVVVLQTIAANLGSMLTPVGNPQNLFLYSKYSLTLVDFLQTLLPLGGVSALLLILLSLTGSRQALEVHFEKRKPIALQPLLGFGVLFVCCLLCVLHLFPYEVVFVLVLVYLLAFSRGTLRQVDYSLLATFVCFFIFVGNLGELSQVREFLSGILEKSTLLTAAGTSQIISNVPAAVLLSGFTEDWKGLLAGVNIGGLGTPIASLASLISLRLYARSPGADSKRYLLLFLLCNALFLLVLLLFA